MKTRQEFLTVFFGLLREAGFFVREVEAACDVAAEVSDADGLPFCAITADGDVIYECFDDDKERTFAECIRGAQQQTGACTTPPLKDAEAIGDGSYKIFESNYILLAFRQSVLWGYEFFTCKKASQQRHQRLYYHERLFYNLTEAKDDFAQRSGLVDERPAFGRDDLTLLLECCTRRLMLDNGMEPDQEQAINQLAARIELYLPKVQDFSPRQYFAERGQV